VQSTYKAGPAPAALSHSKTAIGLGSGERVRADPARISRERHCVQRARRKFVLVCTNPTDFMYPR